ncbi:MAG: hypothetical protein K6U75_15615 [Firmicutes bacterium]|nr:hypothetical protein [Bacillota bacterium]
MAQIRERRPVHLRTSTGKASGCVVLDGILHRVVQASKHQLRRPPAWAFEENILREAERQGATLVQVVDTDTGQTYTASLSRFWTHGVRLDRGYGVQVALPLNQWHREDPAQGRLF